MEHPVSQARSEPQKFGAIEADEIRVGPILITKLSDGGAGIWFGNANQGPMIALFQTSGQCGIGIYAKGNQSTATNICLCVDEDGAGMVQFAKGEEVVWLTFDKVKELMTTRGKP